jgi:hypothetical protein
MSATDVSSGVSGHTAGGEVAAACAVCPHPWALHDRISARYCAATLVGKFDRGCACSPYPEGAGHPEPDKDKDTR